MAMKYPQSTYLPPRFLAPFFRFSPKKSPIRRRQISVRRRAMAGKRGSESSAATRSSKRASSKKRKLADEELEVEEDLEGQFDEEAVQAIEDGAAVKKLSEEGEVKVRESVVAARVSPRKARVHEKEEDEPESRFMGGAVPDAEARRRWPHRYAGKKKPDELKYLNMDNSEGILQSRRHFKKAKVDGHIIFNLYDDAYVQGGEGEDNPICKIIEMFEAVDGALYFTAQWFYRAKDTVIKNHGTLIDPKRVFYSEVMDDNPLDCLVEKLHIVKVSLNIDLEAKKNSIPPCDYYYDMLYLLPYSTLIKAPTDNKTSSETSSSMSSEVVINDTSETKCGSTKVCQVGQSCKPEFTLLDLYSGCGGMSTGLCLGANLSGVNLVTKWAVDLNKFACESLRFNHPETQVRNEAAEDFLSLIKEWEKLCISFSLVSRDDKQPYVDPYAMEEEKEDSENDEEEEDEGETDPEVFEVEKILEACFGDPNETGKRQMYFLVRWKGYGPDHDTWEPLEGLSGCRERMKEFVTQGFKSKTLPLPGAVDVICGGPPCQGVSGFNRFRNKEDPLADEKNKQLIVFMEIVEYLKPKFVLMENVVDLIKFAGGYLGRYALGRLVQMNYQARMGMMAAGAYGVPQFRMRVFLWGARPTEKLPQYPLPTHDVVIRGGVPLEFEKLVVAHDDKEKVVLEHKLYLKDAFSDLPAVENDEQRDEMDYGKDPETEFQCLIRLSKDELLGVSTQPEPSVKKLYDHRPLQMNTDDYQRSCRIPKHKGANFRHLPGVLVGSDNKVKWDPDVPRELLASGKPLIPDYAMSYKKGSSSWPFARLWWDEIVPTVVTRAQPHNRAILHPVQNRVLTVRENARIQGFPDYYKLCGSIKERYIQVGNAVAVPVARALGYSLGLAFQGSIGEEPLMKLPSKFPNFIEQNCESSEDNV